jgi:hypothetical protein
MDGKIKETAFETETLDRLMMIELNIGNLFRQLEEVALKTQKLEMAYYEAFHDRAGKDLRFENQILSLKLNLPSEDGTTPKKS